jgi:hypothetical protein
MGRGYTPKQFIGPFTADIGDQQINVIFTSEFEPLPKELRGCQRSYNIYKRYDSNHKFIILNSNVHLNVGGH